MSTETPVPTNYNLSLNPEHSLFYFHGAQDSLTECINRLALELNTLQALGGKLYPDKFKQHGTCACINCGHLEETHNFKLEDGKLINKEGETVATFNFT